MEFPLQDPEIGRWEPGSTRAGSRVRSINRGAKKKKKKKKPLQS